MYAILSLIGVSPLTHDVIRSSPIRGGKVLHQAHGDLTRPEPWSPPLKTKIYILACFCRVTANQRHPGTEGEGGGKVHSRLRRPAGEKMALGQKLRSIEKGADLHGLSDVLERGRSSSQSKKALTVFPSHALEFVLSPRTWPNSGPSGCGIWRYVSFPSSRTPALTPSKCTRFEPVCVKPDTLQRSGLL